MRYIEENPVKARLCKKAEDWRWSSAARVDGAQASLGTSVGVTDNRS